MTIQASDSLYQKEIKVLSISPNINGFLKLTLLNENLNIIELLIIFYLEVSKSQKQLFLKLHCPKNEQIIWQNSALWN